MPIQNFTRLCEKPGGCHLAAGAAKEYFFETPILLILLRKINKIGVSKTIMELCRKPRPFIWRPVLPKNIFFRITLLTAFAKQNQSKG